MKRLWLGVLTALMAACGGSDRTTVTPSPSPPPSSEQISYPLSELVERLAATGDVSAQALIVSGVNDDLTQSNFPLVLFFTNEGNITFGSYGSEGTTESVFRRGDKNLLAYLAEEGLTVAEFLNHPRLRAFVESHLIPAEVPLSKIRTTQNTRATFQSANGTEIVLSTKENLVPADGPVVYANGVPVDSYCYFDGSEQNMRYLCVADAPLVTDFEWSQ